MEERADVVKRLSPDRSFFFFSSRRRHTRFDCDWSSDVCSSDLIPFTSVSTFDLLMSSLMMVLALAAVQRGDMKWGKIWLFSTALLGLVFLGGQVIEFTEFVHKGLTISTNLFGCTFFVLTGTHGAHVTVGVLWLLTLWVRALQGKLGPANAMTVEITGLYWHFVDVVWIVIFTVVYLIQ